MPVPVAPAVDPHAKDKDVELALYRVAEAHDLPTKATRAAVVELLARLEAVGASVADARRALAPREAAPEPR